MNKNELIRKIKEGTNELVESKAYSTSICSYPNDL